MMASDAAALKENLTRIAGNNPVMASCRPSDFRPNDPIPVKFSFNRPTTPPPTNSLFNEPRKRKPSPPPTNSNFSEPQKGNPSPPLTTSLIENLTRVADNYLGSATFLPSDFRPNDPIPVEFSFNRPTTPPPTNSPFSEPRKREPSERIIDVGTLRWSIEKQLRDRSPSSSRCCIYKIPTELRKHNDTCYVPSTVSIGPFHHGKEHLRAMEPLKFWYLNQLLHRQKTLGRDGTLGQLINAIGVLMVDARDCYQGPIDGSDELFIEIMIVDGCFIIELFRKFDGKLVQRDDTDPVFNLSFMITHLTGDLLLLENQLPWSVLEILFLLTMVPGEETTSLSGLALQFFGSMMLLSKKPVAQSSTLKNMHLLGFIRNTLISQFKFEEGADYSEWDPIPCATSLVDAGVKLRLGNADNILNVKFDNGILEIPPVLIQENAESLFRNLIALEQCDKIFTDQIITSYAILLDYLINTSEDVDLLYRKKILKSVLGAQDIACFFHKFSNDTLIWNFYYKGLSQQVNAYCRRRWPRWKVSLKRNYLNTPWAILSIVAAVVLLILTFIQTLYTIVN